MGGAGLRRRRRRSPRKCMKRATPRKKMESPQPMEEETGGPRGNPHRHGENMPTPHRKDPGRPAGESNPEPSRRQGYSLKSWRLYKLRPAPSMYTPSRQTRSACVRAYRLCVA